jgi:type IV pilus assembly protein PilY1
VFDAVTVSTASAEAQNYVNWYTYYRTRILMAQSSISRVFKPLDSKYRVGYSTISEDTVAEGTNFLNISDFDATQKGKFYTALNAAVPGSYTPLRGALSKAGQYYGNKAPGQSYDPMQYSCQKNFTILSTDGYWNTNDETSTYGPFGLDGNSVGQRDGANAYPSARPKYDGGTTTVTNTNTWDRTETIIKQTDTTTTQYTDVATTQVDTYTPLSPQSNNKVTTYALGTIYNTTTNTSFVTTCTLVSGKYNCTMTVGPLPTGLTAGQNVVISGATSSTYNGTFPVDSTTASTFTYHIDGRSSALTSPSSSSNRGRSFYSPVGCPAGQGQLTTTVTQTDKVSLSSVTTTTATAQTFYTYTQSKTQIVTPYTQAITLVNGAVTNTGAAVAGTPGTPTITNLPSPPDGTPSATSNYVRAAAPVVTNNVTPSGYVAATSTSTSCASSKPSNSTTTATAVAAAVTVTNQPASGSLTASVSAATGTLSDVFATGAVTSIAGTPSTSGGSTNSLADVAFYYYNNDLRDRTAWNNCSGALGTDVCGLANKFEKQNMVTLTIGLGASGLLKYDKNYTAQKNPGSGDFYAVKQGDKTWPIPGDAGTGAKPENIDDLWHAAVNSTDFGTAALPVATPNIQYFSASDPAQLVDSLNTALTTIRQIVGTASAAATSTLQPVTGDNDLFVAKFTSAKWYGDVQRSSIDPATGAISSTTSWSAASMLDARDLTANPRKVYFLKNGVLENFTYANLPTSPTNMQAYFDGFCSKLGVGGDAAPLQCDLIADKTAANLGSNLVSYLLGNPNDNYRARDSRLGDIINGAPLFVGSPRFKYTEHDYAGWAAVTRQDLCAGSSMTQGTVYVGANDGMLHAFDRCDGSEKWAYIPTMVIPNLYKLADTNYPNNHQFYVDGAPQMGDIYVNGAWKTILVGGLNGGGRGYYALDITDPAHPKAMWEFTNSVDANLGLTFGNPIITKRADGTWVVVFASGYNNVSGGDGNGHLMVLNANTGAKLLSIPTGVAGGLAKINAWVESETDNVAKRFYGGDMLGNVWRFDLDSLVQPYGEAFLLAQLAVGGVAQPITIMPELAEVNYLGAKYPVVYIATGRYLGMSDLGTTDQQSIYAFKDALSQTGLGDLRTGGTLVKQDLTTTGRIRTATTNAVDWSSKNGWYVDLPTSGERVNVGMVLAFNVLSVASTVPSANACEIGGTSWLYKLDIASGAAVANAPDNAAGVMLEEGKLIVGQTVVQLMDGSATTVSTLSSGDVRSDTQPPPPANAVLRRTSWRELVN